MAQQTEVKKYEAPQPASPEGQRCIARYKEAIQRVVEEGGSFTLGKVRRALATIHAAETVKEVQVAPSVSSYAVKTRLESALDAAVSSVQSRSDGKGNPKGK